MAVRSEKEKVVGGGGEDCHLGLASSVALFDHIQKVDNEGV